MENENETGTGTNNNPEIVWGTALVGHHWNPRSRVHYAEFRLSDQRIEIPCDGTFSPDQIHGFEIGFEREMTCQKCLDRI